MKNVLKKKKNRKTKNNFKEWCKKAKFQELIDEQSKIKTLIMRGHVVRQKKTNPYADGLYPIKILQYKLNIVSQEIYKRTYKEEMRFEPR